MCAKVTAMKDRQPRVLRGKTNVSSWEGWFRKYLGARDIVHSCRVLAQLVKGPEIDTLVPPQKEKGREREKAPKKKEIILRANERQVSRIWAVKRGDEGQSEDLGCLESPSSVHLHTPATYCPRRGSVVQGTGQHVSREKLVFVFHNSFFSRHKPWRQSWGGYQEVGELLW